MSSSSHLREGDVDSLLQLIEDARHDDPGEAYPWQLLHGLMRVIPCDYDVAYICNDYVNRISLLHQGLEDGGELLGRCTEPEPDNEPFWGIFWETYCGYPQRSRDLRSVVMTTDFHPTAHDRANDPLREVLDDITHCLIVSLPEISPGAYRRIVLRRTEDRAFTERDRQVMALLRPHLQEIWLDAERRRAGVPQLTAREWQVLGMAGAGLSYAEIASALFVSVSTVRKHMEHVRERLGVHSVMAAAAAALPHAPPHLTPPRPRARATPALQGDRPQR